MYNVYAEHYRPYMQADPELSTVLTKAKKANTCTMSIASKSMLLCPRVKARTSEAKAEDLTSEAKARPRTSKPGLEAASRPRQ